MTLPASFSRHSVSPDSKSLRQQPKYKSHAVIARRVEPADSPDDFPTPPWATRALLQHVLSSAELGSLTCLEPACGAGHITLA